MALLLPEARPLTIIVKFLIKTYQVLLSPLLGNRCKFHPSCSEYALEAFESRGFLHGTILSIKRLLRCHPYSMGGFDPVPTVTRKDS